MARDDYLFVQADSFSVQEHQRQQMDGEIENMEPNRLLNTNVDDLVSYIEEKYRIDVPVLDQSNMNVDQKEAKRDVSGDPRRAGFYFDSGRPIHVTGTEVVVEVPFSGDAALFKYRPSIFSTSPPRGEVRGNVIVFRYWSDAPAADQVRGELDRWLKEVNQHLDWQRGSYAGFNASLANSARSAVTRRRDKLLSNQNLVAGLGIALKRRSDATATYSAPEVKRRLTPKTPPATSGAFKPEPVMEEAEYQHIMDVLVNMVKVMERSPKAFQNSDEETLRTHFLVQLNGHYEGHATGETFNYQGKTDILIRSGDRNIFIAECKFWGGAAKLTETIDQLLGYLSWRDSKAAILIFNRNKNFSNVVSAIPDVVHVHPNFQKDEGSRGETGFRYAFRHKDDPAKIIHVTILAFDIPSPAA
jgi:hypothetical protein